MPHFYGPLAKYRQTRLNDGQTSDSAKSRLIPRNGRVHRSGEIPKHDAVAKNGPTAKAVIKDRMFRSYLADGVSEAEFETRWPELWEEYLRKRALRAAEKTE